VCCAALPAATEVLSVVADKLLSVLVFSVGLWPIGLMWLANLQLPVGDVDVKRTNKEWREQLSPEEYKVPPPASLSLKPQVVLLRILTPTTRYPPPASHQPTASASRVHTSMQAPHFPRCASVRQ